MGFCQRVRIVTAAPLCYTEKNMCLEVFHVKQKLIALLLSAVLALSMTACGVELLDGALIIADALLEDETVSIIGGADGPTSVVVTAPDYREPSPPSPAIDEDGTYNSAEDVSLYLYTYGELPDNYITKHDAQDLGWTGGSVEDYAGDGCAIGGDRFGNKEGLLPAVQGRTYYECDVDTVGDDTRGAERIVYSNDGLIYYTADHYEHFDLLYGPDCQEDHLHTPQCRGQQ